MKGKLALLALLAVNLIYAINYLVVKGVSPKYIEPTGFVLFRATGAMLLFWLISLFTPKEKIQKEDWFRILLGALFGVALNQSLFFNGLVLTTPVNAALIMTSNPIFVLIAATFLLKEKLSTRKVIGILLGLAGALVLIQMQEVKKEASNPSLGNLLVLINAISYGLYLMVIKPVMSKYKPVTVIKWVFTFGVLMVLPFGWNQLSEIDLDMPANMWGSIAFVVFFTTFLAYLLSIFALKNVQASVVSSFIYLQPIITAILSFVFLKQTLNTVQILSGLTIFVGVYLVSFSKKSA
jgi:drug/metabolite transporter (DMT)-like permease